jgi:hypothetical protein
MSHEEEDFDIPKELVEKKRRECKKDHSKDKKQVDELERKKANLHKRRIAELQEEDLDDDEEEYKHLWK